MGNGHFWFTGQKPTTDFFRNFLDILKGLSEKVIGQFFWPMPFDGSGENLKIPSFLALFAGFAISVSPKRLNNSPRFFHEDTV